MAPKSTPPAAKPGKRFFRVGNLVHATPEHRRQILGNIVDLMDDENQAPKNKKTKQTPKKKPS